MAIRFKDVPSALGTVRVSFNDLTGQVLGIFQVVPGRTGVIDGDLLNVIANFDGSFQLNANRTGTIQAALANIAADIRSPVTQSARNLFAEANFESGVITSVPTTYGSPNRMNNGLYISTVAQNMSAINDTRETGFASNFSGTQGFGLTSRWDVHIQDQETVTGFGPGAGSPFTDVVTPRSGNRFWRTEVFWGAGTPSGSGPNYTDTRKHYDDINTPGGTNTHDTSNMGRCKPRCAFGWQTTPEIYGMEWDTRMRFGWSVYVPRSWENETNKVGQTGNGPVIMSTFNTIDVDSSPFSLYLMVPSASQGWRLPTLNGSQGALVGATSDTWWCLLLCTNPGSHLEAGQQAVVRKIALSPLGTSGPASDRGKWTDFVLDFCLNPFTNATTSNGVSFRANTGRCTVYKSTGNVDGNGNRQISESSPIFSDVGPFGMRPFSADLADRHQFNLRVYAFGLRSENDTSLHHSRWLGFDDIRMGYSENKAGRNIVTNYQDGPTLFDDVCPSS